jgi:hypothetical protein
MAAVQPEPWFWDLITNNNNKTTTTCLFQRGRVLVIQMCTERVGGGRLASWPENIKIMLIISFSRVPYTVVLPEYEQVGRKIST